jgi:hypothetical protein
VVAQLRNKRAARYNWHNGFEGPLRATRLTRRQRPAWADNAG